MAHEPYGLAVRFWRRVNKDGPLIPGMATVCWEWMGALRPDGYGVIGLGRRSEGIERTHRVAWILKHGEIPAGKFVLHRCDNRKCVRHLFLGNQRDNIRDCMRKGRHSAPPIRRGESNNKFKITEQMKVYILSSPRTGHALSIELGLNRSTINKLRRIARGLTR